MQTDLAQQCLRSEKFRRVITGTYTQLLTFGEDMQLAANLSAMSYEELLAGLLFPGMYSYSVVTTDSGLKLP